MSYEPITIKASKEGTKYHMGLDDQLIYILESVTVLNGECTVSFEVEDDDSDDYDGDDYSDEDEDDEVDDDEDKYNDIMDQYEDKYYDD